MIESLVLDYRAQLQHAVILALTLYAFRFSEKPEKLVGAILTSVFLADYAYHFFFPLGSIYHDVNIGHLVIDAMAFVALLPVAMRANRIYPLWVLAAQLIMLLMHFNREISDLIDPMAYWIITRMPSYIQVLALAIGIVAQRRRARAGQQYPSWRSSSRTSPEKTPTP